MSLNLPPQVADEVELWARRWHISLDEAALRLIQAGLAQQSTDARPRVSYTSLFGCGKGTYGSPLEADRALAVERDSW